MRKRENGKKMIRSIVLASILAVVGAVTGMGMVSPAEFGEVGSGAAISVGMPSAYAANAFNQAACNDLSGDERLAAGCDDTQTVPVVATNIFQIIISLLGIVAVLMIVVAGQRYITSNGEPEKIKQARNMIIYSLIGLIVAILAFAVVTFVQHSIS